MKKYLVALLLVTVITTTSASAYTFDQKGRVVIDQECPALFLIRGHVVAVRLTLGTNFHPNEVANVAEDMRLPCTWEQYDQASIQRTAMGNNLIAVLKKVDQMLRDEAREREKEEARRRREFEDSYVGNYVRAFDQQAKKEIRERARRDAERIFRKRR